MAEPYSIIIKTPDGQDAFSADLRGYGDPKEDDYAAALVRQAFDTAISYLVALQAPYVRGALPQKEEPIEGAPRPPKAPGAVAQEE